MKINIIKDCAECLYSSYYVEPPEESGKCLYKDMNKPIKNIRKIPKWCPLEDV